MARSQAEQLRELQLSFSTVQARLDTVTRDVAEVSAGVKRLAGEDARAVLADVAATRQEIAVVRQRLDDHLKRYELWEARRWAFVMALVGAVLSLASGLIVTLARK